MDDRDRACIPHTTPPSRSSPPQPDPSDHRLFDWENALQSLFPRGNPAPNFVLIQAVESVFAKLQPRAVGIVALHHVAPDFYRQPEARFLVPGNGSDLQPAL